MSGGVAAGAVGESRSSWLKGSPEDGNRTPYLDDWVILFPHANFTWVINSMKVLVSYQTILTTQTILRRRSLSGYKSPRWQLKMTTNLIHKLISDVL